VYPGGVEPRAGQQVRAYRHVAAADQHLTAGEQVAHGGVVERDRLRERRGVRRDHLAADHRDLAVRGEGVQHRLRPSRLDGGVGVDERDDLTAGGVQADVAAARDVVRTVAQHPQGQAGAGRHGRRQGDGLVGGVVVDEQDLRGRRQLGGEGFQAGLDGPAAVEGEDYDADQGALS